VGRAYNFWSLNLLVHHLNSRLQNVNVVGLYSSVLVVLWWCHLGVETCKILRYVCVVSNYTLFQTIRTSYLIQVIKLRVHSYLQIYNTFVTRLHIRLIRAFKLPIHYVTRTLNLVHFYDFIDMCFIIPLFAIITKLRACILIEGEKPLPQFFPFT
jgi:hypothetical protein